jgi:hypothetical protein
LERKVGSSWKKKSTIEEQRISKVFIWLQRIIDIYIQMHESRVSVMVQIFSIQSEDNLAEKEI